MYHQFNIQQFHVLPTQCICFVWISEQTAIISLYSINWLVCITETESVYSAVRTGYVWFWQRVWICSVCCTLLAVTMRGCRRNGPNYHAMRTFPNSGVLCKVKRSALNGDHVHPSTCGLVSATKPLRWSDFHEIRSSFLKAFCVTVILY
jgi:hypothetical protein